MKLSDAMKAIFAERGTNYQEMSKKLGGLSRSTISERVNHGNMSVEKLLEMLDILDCDLVIQSRTHYAENWVIDAVGGREKT